MSRRDRDVCRPLTARIFPYTGILIEKGPPSQADSWHPAHFTEPTDRLPYCSQLNPVHTVTPRTNCQNFAHICRPGVLGMPCSLTPSVSSPYQGNVANPSILPSLAPPALSAALSSPDVKGAALRWTLLQSGAVGKSCTPLPGGPS